MRDRFSSRPKFSTTQVTSPVHSSVDTNIKKTPTCGVFFMGWPTGIEPVLGGPQPPVLTITLRPPCASYATGSRESFQGRDAGCGVVSPVGIEPTSPD